MHYVLLKMLTLSLHSSPCCYVESKKRESKKKTLVNLSLDKNLETVLCSRHIVEKRTQYCHGLDGIIATHGST